MKRCENFPIDKLFLSATPEELFLSHQEETKKKLNHQKSLSSPEQSKAEALNEPVKKAKKKVSPQNEKKNKRILGEGEREEGKVTMELVLSTLKRKIKNKRFL